MCAVMFATSLVLALSLFSQVPPARCVSAYGLTRCGYHCTAAYGQVRCADTPQGACGAAYGQVTCWDPEAPTPNGAQAECLSAYGTTSCGYGCTAALGLVRCAKSPGGRCTPASGTIGCNDVERDWSAVDEASSWPDPREERWPVPECVSQFGTSACGYHCKSEFGAVQCAQTPWGACAAEFGKVACWDPPRWVTRDARFQGERATCSAQFGAIACGYRCATSAGRVGCAPAPWGICRGSSGGVACWPNPPLRR